MNNFLGLNIADNPMNIIKNHASVWVVIGAVLIPVLAAFTQWLSVQLSMQMGGNPQANDQSTQTMKTMNNVMPLMSAFFCLTLPVGMGIYWIASAVVRTVQQVFINKQLAKEDMNALIQKNIEKNKAKMEKMGGVSVQAIQRNASINTRQIDVEAQARRDRAKSIQKEARNIADDAGQVKGEFRPGSLAEKANMVSVYNKAHQKK